MFFFFSFFVIPKGLGLRIPVWLLSCIYHVLATRLTIVLIPLVSEGGCIAAVLVTRGDALYGCCKVRLEKITECHELC